MRTLAIDPSIRALGWAVLLSGKVIDTGVIRPPTDLPWPERFRVLANRLARLVVLHEPNAIAVEDQHGVQAGEHRDGRSSADTTRVREVIGAIRILAGETTLVEPQIATWKRCLNLPRTAKGDDVKRAVRALTGWQGKLTNDSADAVGIGICGERMARKEWRE